MHVLTADDRMFLAALGTRARYAADVGAWLGWEPAGAEYRIPGERTAATLRRLAHGGLAEYESAGEDGAILWRATPVGRKAVGL